MPRSAPIRAGCPTLKVRGRGASGGSRRSPARGQQFCVGAQARIQRFNANGTLDSSWQPVQRVPFKLFPATDGMLFVGGAYSAVNDVARNSLARFRADGTLDSGWARMAQCGRDIRVGVAGFRTSRAGRWRVLRSRNAMNGAWGGIILSHATASTLNRAVADGSRRCVIPPPGAASQHR